MINWAEALPASMSAMAALASALAAFWSAKVARQGVHLHIKPVISIEFDGNVQNVTPSRRAVITNESGCPVLDLQVEVSHPADSDPRVFKLAGRYDLRRWLIRHRKQLAFGQGSRAEVECDDWFRHAREIIFVKGIPEEEIARRCQVFIEIKCKRESDRKTFRFTYIYQVVSAGDALSAISIAGNNPAEEGKHIVLKRKATREG